MANAAHQHYEPLPADLFAQHNLAFTAPDLYRLTDSGRQLLKPERNAPPIDTGQPLSGHPFDIIEHTYRTLAIWLEAVSRMPDFYIKLPFMARRIANLVEEEPDAALAATLLVPMVSYTAGHSVQVAVMLARLAPLLNISPEDKHSLLCAALTMNIGAAALQNTLHEQTDPLSSGQSQHIRLHPLLSSALLRESGITDPLWHRLVCEHHEMPDGSGYPIGYPASYLHPLSAALRIADILGAKLCGRRYRKRMSAKNAWLSLYQPGDTSNPDAVLIQRFVRSIGLYPSGSFVRLENKKVALVVAQTQNLRHPKLLAFDRGGGFITLDTQQEGNAIVSPAEFTIPDNALLQLAKAWD